MYAAVLRFVPPALVRLGRGRRRLKPALGARRGAPRSPPAGTGRPANWVASRVDRCLPRAGGFRGERREPLAPTSVGGAPASLLPLDQVGLDHRQRLVPRHAEGLDLAGAEV